MKIATVLTDRLTKKMRLNRKTKYLVTLRQHSDTMSERQTNETTSICVHVHVYVCVCVSERQRKR